MNGNDGAMMVMSMLRVIVLSLLSASHVQATQSQHTDNLKDEAVRQEQTSDYEASAILRQSVTRASFESLARILNLSIVGASPFGTKR